MVRNLADPMFSTNLKNTFVSHYPILVNREGLVECKNIIFFFNSWMHDIEL